MNSNMFGSDKYSKIKNTTLEHYGVDCIFKDKDFIEKRAKQRKRNNLLKRCSLKWINHVIEKRILPKNFKIIDIDINFEKGVWFELECPECKKTFKWSEEIRIQTGTHAFPYCEDCAKGRNQSLEEKSVLNYIKTFYSGEIIINTKKVLGGKELDIYFPSLNKAIEYDGYHWHSYEDIKNKINLCKQKNIKVLNILNFFWNDDKDRIQNLIKDFIINENNNEWEMENLKVLSRLSHKTIEKIIESDLIIDDISKIKNIPNNFRITYHCNICGKNNRLLVETIKLNKNSICPSCRKKEKMKNWLNTHGGKIPKKGEHF